MANGSGAVRWAERAVLVAAALSVVATSPPRWFVEATLPPPPPPGSKASVATVFASQEPEVLLSGEAMIPKTAQRLGAVGTWPGRAEYLIPAEVSLERVYIEGTCGGGLCSRCTAPKGAYVRVAGLRAASVWSIEAETKPMTAVLEPDKPGPRYVLMLETSGAPWMRVLGAGPPHGASAHVYITRTPATPPNTREIHVDWHADSGLSAPISVPWTLRATLLGPCPSTAECAAPPTELVRIGPVRAAPPP